MVIECIAGKFERAKNFTSLRKPLTSAHCKNFNGDQAHFTLHVGHGRQPILSKKINAPFLAPIFN